MMKIRLVYNKGDYTAKLEIGRRGIFKRIFRYEYEKIFQRRWHINEIFRWKMEGYNLPFIEDQDKGIYYDDIERVLTIEARRMNERIGRELACRIIIRNIKEIEIHRAPNNKGGRINLDFVIEDIAKGIISFFAYGFEREFWINIESFPLYFMQEDIYEGGRI